MDALGPSRPGQSTRHARGDAKDELLARRNRGPPRGNREHDPEADRDHPANGEPDARNLPQYPRLPEREPRAEQEDEIADEVNLQESHRGLGSRKSAHSAGSGQLA